VGKGKVLAVVGVLVAIYLVAAPYITVLQIQSAAERNDGEALSEHIDFPSVRQSIKDQMNAVILKEMSEDKKVKKDAFAELGAAFAGVMIDRLVDSYVTPAGITQLMAGENPTLEGDKPDSKSGRKPLSEASRSYESLSKFVVRVKGDTGEGKFVLRRRGLGWKITEIIVPMEK